VRTGGEFTRDADSFPPSPDGGFIEGSLLCWRQGSTKDGFHHLQMVASLRDYNRALKFRCKHRFHHLQMVASLRGHQGSTKGATSPSFHHLQMVASLRVMPRHVAWRPVSCFHHLQMVASLRAFLVQGRGSDRSMFPPSPDGGFIEGRRRASPVGFILSFHHLQMVASLRVRSLAEPDGADVAPGFHHLQMVASLRGNHRDLGS